LLPNIPLWQQGGVARISEEVSAEQIQSIARELQAIRNQIQTISSQISEYGITVEALGEQDSGKPVYRSLGNLLLEVADREKLLSELTDAKSSLEEHLKRLVEREENLRESYEEKAEQFERE